MSSNERLKTLRDVYNKFNQSYISDEAEEVVEELRKVAREHLRYLDDLQSGRIPNTTNAGSELSWYWIDGQMNFIRHFFNLEGE